MGTPVAAFCWALAGDKAPASHSLYNLVRQPAPPAGVWIQKALQIWPPNVVPAHGVCAALTGTIKG